MTPKERTDQQSLLTVTHHDYEKGLKSHAFFRVHNKTTSNDLVQDTFIKTWGYLVKGGKIEMMKSFLYHVLNNLIVDEYRKRKNTSLDLLIEKGLEPSSDGQEEALDFFDGRIAIKLIKRLPKKYQQVIRMRYVQDLSLSEISIITGQSRNTISVQTHRGLKKLKKLFNRI